MDTIQQENPEWLGARDTSQCIAFRIGGVSIEVDGQCPGDLAMPPSLEAFRYEGGVPDISLWIEWVESLNSFAEQSLFDSGSVWRLYKDGPHFTFDFSSSIVSCQPYKRLIVDRQFRKARLQMSTISLRSAEPPIFPLEYPLDELLIMHRLTQEKAIELHGCGIIRADGIGNLFVGHSGAGKSTTTRLWTASQDVEILSDDRIIVRRDEADLARAVVKIPREAGANSGEHEVLRLRDCSASRTNHFAQDDKKKRIRMYGTPWHGEAMYASPNSAPLARIFILEHGHGNVLTPLTPSQAVAELFARSFVPFHRHEYVDSALTFLQEVVDAVPVYRYAFEPDQCAVDTILNLHD